MGWTTMHVEPDISGKIDRKSILEDEISDDYEILKSQMVGSTYYGAIKRDGKVFGMVILTRIDNHDQFNFGFKGIPETMGPVESKCPVSILKLLSPTDDEYATEWRKRCYEYAKADAARKNFLKDLRSHPPIEYTRSDRDINSPGETVFLYWYESKRFKSGGFYTDGTYRYPSKLFTPENTKIVNH